MRILLMFLLLTVAAVALAAPGDEIQAAEKSWRQALVARDVGALEKLYTADLIYAHSTGKVESKKEYLDRLASGRQRYESWTEESGRIVLHGDSAVSHSISRATGTNDSGAFNDHLMVMHLWVKQQGVWRLAAHQTTKIP
jgi:ketosteroid isomerase-like protein